MWGEVAEGALEYLSGMHPAAGVYSTIWGKQAPESGPGTTLHPLTKKILDHEKLGQMSLDQQWRALDILSERSQKIAGVKDRVRKELGDYARAMELEGGGIEADPWTDPAMVMASVVGAGVPSLVRAGAVGASKVLPAAARIGTEALLAGAGELGLGTITDEWLGESPWALPFNIAVGAIMGASYENLIGKGAYRGTQKLVDRGSKTSKLVTAPQVGREVPDATTHVRTEAPLVQLEEIGEEVAEVPVKKKVEPKKPVSRFEKIPRHAKETMSWDEVKERFPRAVQFAEVARAKGAKGLEGEVDAFAVANLRARLYKDVPWRLDENGEAVVEEGWLDTVRHVEGLSLSVKNKLKYDTDLDGFIKKAREQGVITTDRHEEVTRLLFDSLKHKPDFQLDVELDPRFSGAYKLSRNLVGVGELQALPHEVGHWAWFNVLDGKDRIEICKMLVSQDPKALRKYIAELDADHLGDFGMKRADYYASNVSEFFAEQFAQYVYTYAMPKDLPDVLTTALGKVVNWAKSLYVKMQDKNLIHPDLEPYFKKIINAPNPAHVRPKKIAEIADNVTGHPFFRTPKQVREIIEERAFRPTDPETQITDWRFMPEEDATQAEKLTGIVDFEHARVMAYHHGMYDVDIDESIANLKKMADPRAEARIATMFEVEPEISQEMLDLEQKINKVINSTKMGEARKAEIIKGLENTLSERGQQALRRNKTMYREFRDWTQGMLDFAESVKAAKEGHAMAGKTKSAVAHMNLMSAKLDDLSEPGQLSLVGRFSPYAVSFGCGIDFDDENGVPIPFAPGVRVSWSPTKWATSAYGAGPILVGMQVPIKGKKAPKWIKQGGDYASTKLWGKLEKRLPWIYENVARTIHPTERLTPELHRKKVDLLRMKTHLRRSIDSFAARMNRNFSKDEQRLISDIIEEEGTEWMHAPEILKQQAGEVKKLLTGIRQALIDSGVPEELLNEVGPQYLHRVYKRHLGRKSVGLGKRMYDAIWGNYLIKRGVSKKLRPGDTFFTELTDELPLEKIKEGTVINHYFRPGAPTDSIMAIKGTKLDHGLMKDSTFEIKHKWKVEGIDAREGRSSLSIRRDFTRLERQQMGEVREVAFRVSTLGRQVGHDVAMGNLFKEIAGNPKWSVDLNSVAKADREAVKTGLQNKGWVKVPTTKVQHTKMAKFGVMAGKYVDPDVLHVLKTVTGRRFQSEAWEKVFNIWSGATRAWKLGKTAFNPATHGFNFVANNAMCIFDGRNPAMVLKLGAESLIKKDEHFYRAVNAGMLDSNILRGELKLGDFLEEINKVDTDDIMEVQMTLLGKALKYGKKAGAKGLRGPMRLYEFGDEIFKLGVFRQELAKGVNDTDALRAANRLFFDYRDIPRGIAAIRDWGAAPFITYTYKALPVVAQTLRDHPHRIVGALGVFGLLNEFVYVNEFGGGAEQQEKWERELQPEYMGGPDAELPWQGRMWGIGPKGTVRIPSRNKYAQFLDYTRWFPAADTFEAGGLFGGYPFSFHPAATILFGLTQGYDPTFEKSITKIRNPRTLSERLESTKDKIRFIERTLLPNLPFPGQFSYEKLGNALAAEGVIPKDVANELGWTGTDYYGSEVHFPEELLSTFGIWKARRLYTGEEHNRRLDKLDWEIISQERDLERMYNDRRSTPAELRRKEIKLDKTIRSRTEMMKELTKMRREALEARKKGGTLAP